jgi:hypothetical protein
VLDPGTPPAMATPGTIADDSIPAKDRGDELGDAAVATVGQDAPVLLAERLDRGATIMDAIVAIVGAETMRCAADLGTAKVAASSRRVRFVRGAAQTSKTRWLRERDHG